MLQTLERRTGSSKNQEYYLNKLYTLVNSKAFPFPSAIYGNVQLGLHSRLTCLLSVVACQEASFLTLDFLPLYKCHIFFKQLYNQDKEHLEKHLFLLHSLRHLPPIKPGGGAQVFWGNSANQWILQKQPILFIQLT